MLKSDKIAYYNTGLYPYLIEAILMTKQICLKLLIILTAVWVSVNSVADEVEMENVRNSIQSVLPDMEIDLIEESAISGLYAVLIGAEVFYVSADGQYLLRGDLIDIHNKLNVSEEKRTVARRRMLQQVPEQDLINFSPDNPDYTVYVFTDVTCPYCQRLQGDIKEINDNGIAVKYLAFPRQGVGTPASEMMEKIWCSTNRQEAFLDMMIGLDVEETTCENPVTEHFSLGQAMGVRGTPAIFTDSGRYLPGYLPPDKLLEEVSKE